MIRFPDTGGDYYRLTGPGGRFCAWEFVDRKKEHALQILVMTSAEGNPLPVHTVVKGLLPDRLYCCCENGQVYSGRTWMGAGLTLHGVPKEYESVLMEWEMVHLKD